MKKTYELKFNTGVTLYKELTQLQLKKILKSVLKVGETSIAISGYTIIV